MAYPEELALKHSMLAGPPISAVAGRGVPLAPLAVIFCEPFFGSADRDWLLKAIAMTNRMTLGILEPPVENYFDQDALTNRKKHRPAASC
jgi:hypothetical protein